LSGSSPAEGSRQTRAGHVVLLALVDDIVVALLLVVVLVALVLANVVSPTVAVVIGTAGAIVIGLVAYMTTMALLMKPKIGGGPIGRRGTAVTELEPAGTVLVDGERWQAVSGVPVKKGSTVVVLAAEGLRLTVEPAKGADGGA